ncbi:hypothetical protein GA0071314_2794 [Halomonas sp. HL-93]|nr:hypothetical protein GA0071314_2794 [Halomonas sp. HL-93]SNY96974.1 hypothetical protein SAMN04488142_1536 [Halomonas sp. hl-4]
MTLLPCDGDGAHQRRLTGGVGVLAIYSLSEGNSALW